MAKGNSQKQSNGSALDFEAQIWAAADKMRGHMDASEYKTLRSANTNCSNGYC
jgi:type I restriction-modification system DNA methylase subunit